MNAHCIACRHIRVVALPRGTGYVPMFYCLVTGQRYTHIIDEASPRPCLDTQKKELEPEPEELK